MTDDEAYKITMSYFDRKLKNLDYKILTLCRQPRGFDGSGLDQWSDKMIQSRVEWLEAFDMIEYLNATGRWYVTPMGRNIHDAQKRMRGEA